MKAWAEGTATSPRVLRRKDLPSLKAALRLGSAKLQRTRAVTVDAEHGKDLARQVVVHWTWTIGNEWVSATREVLEADEEILDLVGPWQVATMVHDYG